MSIDYGQLVVDLMLRMRIIAHAREVAGASPDRVRQLEHRLGARFPSIYREVLTSIGSDSGPLFRGLDFTCDQLDSNWINDLNTELIHQHLKPLDASRVHIFLCEQGVIHHWFYVDVECDDPQVFQYSEGGEQIHTSGYSFSEWLLMWIAHAGALLHASVREASAGDRANIGIE